MESDGLLFEESTTVVLTEHFAKEYVLFISMRLLHNILLYSSSVLVGVCFISSCHVCTVCVCTCQVELFFLSSFSLFFYISLCLFVGVN